MTDVVIDVPEELAREIEVSHLDLRVLLKRFVKQLEEEKEIIDWSVKLQRTSRSGRFNELKKRGLL